MNEANDLVSNCTYACFTLPSYLIAQSLPSFVPSTRLYNSNFNGPIRQSGNCHRLIRYAYEKQRELQIGSCVPLTPCVKNDLQGKLLNVLFKATFQDGEDIGDEYVLARYAEEVGLMTQDEVRLIKSPPCLLY